MLRSPVLSPNFLSVFAGRIVLESQTVASMGDAAGDVLVTPGQVAVALAS